MLTCEIVDHPEAAFSDTMAVKGAPLTFKSVGKAIFVGPSLKYWSLRTPLMITTKYVTSILLFNSGFPLLGVPDANLQGMLKVRDINANL